MRMGKFLKEQYGNDMVAFGFSFFEGSFNAVPYDLELGQVTGSLTAHRAVMPPEDSYGFYFRTADIPRMFLDLRGLDFDSTAVHWLKGPLRFRTIGSVYDSDNPLLFFYLANLPEEFDVIIYFQTTSPSTLL